MKKNFIKRLTATVLTLCMAASLIPLSTISSSAAINAESFDSWSTTQLYSRGYGATSTILNCLAKASGSETVQSVTSLIDKYILQSDTTGDQLSAIQDTCDKILESTKDTQHIVEDINKKISQQTINASSKEANAAYKEQVTDYLTHHDESIYDFYNVYLAYTDYLQYAISDDAQQNKDKIIEKEKNYLDELSEFYASQTGKYWDSTTSISQYDFYKSQIYTTNTLDICFSGILNSLLNNMDPNSYAVEKGERFIDCAAQYAYYAYPFSSEQAQFMDYAVEYQINAVTTVLMLYQDFIAHRAEYFEELSVDEDSRATYNNAWDQLIGYYDKSVNKYTKSITNFLNSDIVLKDVGAKTTLDKYLREQSATNRFEDEKRSFSLDNTNYIDKRKYNGNQYSMPSLTSKDKGNLSFYKNASVTVEDGRLKFTEFYVLNGDAVDPAYMNLSSFDINDENSWGTFFGGICDTHYLNTDFYNLAYGKYSDGVNTYSAISNESQLKNIINSTYYTANCTSPYDYFSDYLGYGEDEDVYLLLNQPTQFYSKPEKTRYTLFDALNISDSKSYPTTWSSETFQQNTIPNGSKFALILTPTENVSKSKIDTNLVGEGEITVSGLENGNAISGETIDVKITAPENCWIKSITAYYHNDKNDTTKKVLSDGLTTNEFTLNYPVPYSNVTIEVVTKEIPSALNTDANGNFIVSSPDDLYQMAAMVNSGYESYVYGNYVLTKNITLEGENNWSTPIGTTDSPFKGTFDGQRNVIYNLSLDSNNEDANFGLFGTIIGGEVHNLYVDIETYSVLFCHDSVGPICGNVKNGKILNCIAIGNFAGGAKAVGGIAGTAENSIIKNCNSELLIFSDKHSYTDGICGVNNNSQIIDCKSNSQIYS